MFMTISAVACLNKKMSISVIIPYYNESETILKTLRSIACQSYTPDEVLLIDWVNKVNISNPGTIYDP